MVKSLNQYFVILIISITTVGLFCVCLVAYLTDNSMRSKLLMQANIAAHSINIERIISLSGSQKDLSSSDYKRIKSQLTQIRNIQKDSRFMYLMGQYSNKKVFFFVDSQPVDSKDYAPPGLIYEEISNLYLDVFDTKKEAVVGPITDRWGTLVTALIPLKNPQNGELVAVFGMDNDAKSWNKKILLNSSMPLIITILLITSIILIRLKKKTELIYLEKEEKNRQVFENSPTGLIYYTNKGVITDVNDATIFIFGSSREKLIGFNIMDIPDKNYTEKALQIANGKTASYEGEYTSFTGGKTSAIKIDWIPIMHSGKVTAGIGIIEDISERKKVEKDLYYQANYDYLTNLPNRILFGDRLSQGIEKAKRNNTKIALFFIDLDHFKQINDSLGHEAGDKVLKIVAKRFLSVIRKEDTLSRLGGDEFTIIMEELKEDKDASLLAQKIIQILAKPIEFDNNILYITSSIGISLYPKDDTDVQNLLKYADTAMYKAKDKGRNNFQFYSWEMTELTLERVAMETSFHQALEKEEFLVYYQTQIDGKTNKLTGMEALVRWEHPVHGLTFPGKFIPLAEETGLIVKLDQFVMKSAMKQIKKWHDMGLNPGILALNLSIKQLQDENFISILNSMIKDTKIKPEWIEFEITEGHIMNDPEKAIVALRQISSLGIKLAVDDFGTGYSSLSYLKRLPIDKLKIDKSFIDNLPNDEEDVAIVKAIIVLSESLNLKVIAEGVETKEQKEFLVKNGCTVIQGYYYSQPIPAKMMEKILLKG